MCDHFEINRIAGRYLWCLNIISQNKRHVHFTKFNSSQAFNQQLSTVSSSVCCCIYELSIKWQMPRSKHGCQFHYLITIETINYTWKCCHDTYHGIKCNRHSSTSHIDTQVEICTIIVCTNVPFLCICQMTNCCFVWKSEFCFTFFLNKNIWKRKLISLIIKVDRWSLIAVRPVFHCS